MADDDVPALISANIGIVLGISSTKYSREASDLILLDDNFANIVKVVEEGRAIFSNMRV